MFYLVKSVIEGNCAYLFPYSLFLLCFTLFKYREITFSCLFFLCSFCFLLIQTCSHLLTKKAKHLVETCKHSATSCSVNRRNSLLQDVADAEGFCGFKKYFYKCMLNKSTEGY